VIADMYNDRTASIRRTLLAVVAALAVAGCAADREYNQGMDLVKQGQPIKGLESLKRAADLEPRNTRFQADYLLKQQEVVRTLLTAGQDHVARGAWDDAARAYQEVLRVEPSNSAALRGLKLLEGERRAAVQLATADKLMVANKPDQALEIARQVLREIPRHERAEQLRRTAEERVETDRQTREEHLAAKAAFRRPVSLTFRDTPLKMIFEALSRAASINVVVDRDVKSDVKTTVFVKDAPIEDAIDVLLLQNQLEKRVLNGNTILVYPATAAKQKEFAELKVRSFQLSNIDAALMANIIKTMIKTKDIVTDPKTNILVMRDTAEAVSLAERLVQANDVPDAEVMLEVHVLEVSATRANELGVKLPTSFTLERVPHADGNGGTNYTKEDLRNFIKGNVLVNAATGSSLNLMLQDGDTQLLASPQIRTRSKEKARILVGDKLPQITNVLSANGSTGANNTGYSALTGNIQYIDVGIKLEVEPEVYTDGDVGIKMNLEVSNVTGTVTSQSGTAYQIGTRSAQTTLRLHDGETQILGGLIRDTDNESAQKVPGLGQLPMVGRLFSNHKVDGQKTEIVVAITPRIIRGRAIPDLRNADAWSGSDTSVRDRPLRLDSIGALKITTPKPDAPAHSAPRVAPAPLPAPVRPPVLEGPATPPAAEPDASAPEAGTKPAVAAPATPVAPKPGPMLPASALTRPTVMPRIAPRGVPMVQPPAPEPAEEAASAPQPDPKP